MQWSEVFPERVMTTSELLDKAKSDTMTGLEYEELNHLLDDPMLWYYAHNREELDHPKNGSFF